jgi:hypothetical protein
LDEQLKLTENELAPAREAVSALVSEELTAIDLALGAQVIMTGASFKGVTGAQ